MSASNATTAQLELIESLTQEEIPIKLRCAICSRLAVNAFRLPCCDQIICETCQSTLPSSCPVCEHTPVSAEDCKPNKALRTTIKIFLRTEEKKREALRQKEVKNSPPATPLEPEPPLVEPVTAPEPIAEENQAATAEIVEDTPQINGTSADPVDGETTDQAQQDIPQASIEEIAPGQESTAEGDVENTDIDEINAAEKADEDATEKGSDGESKQGATQVAGFEFDPNAAGGFPGMGMGGEMNPMMQQMLMMQNGMGAGFGNFPMMGMPGMNMDPMAMQAMLMNGGFGAGMNGMPMGMGMGMGGFNGGMGSGFNNGWNDQSSWSNDNFSNHPNGQGDYGNNFGNSAHTGYNQTNNYGRPNQFNDYQNGYGSQGYRGRGRGRGGGYGRGGGFGHGSNEAFSQQLPQQFGSGQQAHGPISETGAIPTGPKAGSVPAGNVDEFGREIRAKSGDQEDSPENPTAEAGAQQDNDGNVIENAQANNGGPESEFAEANDGSTMPIQTFDEVQAAAFQNGTNGYHDGYNVNGYGAPRGGYSNGFRGGRGGGFGAMQPPVKPVDVPINAPKGPKAMREGLPNTSIRGRPFSMVTHTRGNSRNDASASASVAPEPSDKEHQDRSPSRERSKSRERRRSRSGSRSRHHRRHRHRSNSRSEDERETEERRERRRERRRRREEEDEQRAADDADEVVEEKTERVDEDRSRSASPSESRRSGHKSRRDREKYRERDRETEHKSSSHKHRSSRRHRDDRSRSRDRDHRERRHRHSRHQSEEAADKPDIFNDTAEAQTPIEANESARRPSVISNGTNGIEIKGVSIKGASTRNKPLDEIKIPTGPRKDRVSSSTKDREKDRSSNSRNYHDKDHPPSRRRDSERSGRDKDRDREREKDKSKSKGDSKSTTAPAVQDPHTMEREARNRERLLKESQRLAALTGGESRKRSRDDGDDAGNGRKGRRTGKNRRSGAVAGDEEEARLTRMEAEREGARWG